MLSEITSKFYALFQQHGAERDFFVINDPTINKIYEGGEVELSDEEYDEGFDESLRIKHKRRLKY